MRLHLRFAVAFIIAALYCVSLSVPSIEFVEGIPMTGSEAFSESFRVLIGCAVVEWDWWVFGGPWMANPALWIAGIFLLLGRFRVSLVSAACGVSWAFGVFVVFTSAVIEHPGYWLWLGSLLGLTIVSGVAALNVRRRSKQSRLARTP